MTLSFPLMRRAARGLAAALAGCAILACAGLATPAEALTLDQIGTAGKLRLGYREDARPFSFKDEAGKPAGFTVSLCNAVADEIRSKLSMPDLPVEWVPVTDEGRVAAIKQGQVDMICGADSVTLASRADMSFSIPIFESGIGAVLRADSAAALRNVLEGKPDTGPYWRGSPARILSAKTFAVVQGTTTEAWLKERIGHFQLDSTILPVANYDAGLKAVSDGSANVFFGNRAVIVEAAGPGIEDGSLMVLERNFTSEPVAIALPLDSDALRLAVDTALSRVFMSGDFRDLYRKWFGAPDAATLVFYATTALPE